ncbi:MAG: 5-oxoprolinase subunit PxpB [Hydrogenibacillus sp.]|nr:5-oxoprolinase subunit PxpB [Hydrogenibacillus sp.]
MTFEGLSPRRIVPLGERLLLLEFADRPGAEVTAAIAAWRAALEAKPFPGLVELVPGYTTLGIVYDPLLVTSAAVSEAPLRTESRAFRRVQAILLEREGEVRERFAESLRTRAAQISRRIEIPVVYDGMDLPALAERVGLSVEDVVRLHSDPLYTVYMIGFMPGFPYLGDVPEALRLPRKTTPRARVPAGSVGIAGSQTGIYPLESPGGWWIIGRTTFVLFDPAADPPATLQSGDRVRFVPVGKVSG